MPAVVWRWIVCRKVVSPVNLISKKWQYLKLDNDRLNRHWCQSTEDSYAALTIFKAERFSNIFFFYFELDFELKWFSVLTTVSDCYDVILFVMIDNGNEEKNVWKFLEKNVHENKH